MRKAYRAYQTFQNRSFAAFVSPMIARQNQADGRSRLWIEADNGDPDRTGAVASRDKVRQVWRTKNGEGIGEWRRGRSASS
jgi:hypothetical protein